MKMPRSLLIVLIVLGVASSWGREAEQPSLWRVQQILAGKKLATSKNDYALETYILSHDHYQIELLTNLDQVPETGVIIVATFPKPKGGSGFPARVFAILPD